MALRSCSIFFLFFSPHSTYYFTFQICIVQGTRSGIERCLELIQEKLPLHENPDLSLKQINEPTTEEDLLHNQINEGLLVTLPAGQLATANMTAIISTANFFIQLPDNPTHQHLQRLEECMFYVYERMQDRVPKVRKLFYLLKNVLLFISNELGWGFLFSVTSRVNNYSSF